MNDLLEPGEPEPRAAPVVLEGEYLPPAAGPAVAIAGIVLTIAGAIYLLFRLHAFGFRELEQWLPGQLLPYLRLAAALFVVLLACLLTLAQRASLRTLSWDAKGLTFTPIWGRPLRFGWDSVVSLDLPPTGLKRVASERTDALLYLDLIGRRQITIDPEGIGYAALVSAMTAHHKVWDAVKPRLPATAPDESEWDGVRAPAEGFYQAPWWLLPSRLAVVLLAAWLAYHLSSYLFVANPDRPPWYLRQYQAYAVLVVIIVTAFVAVEGVRRCLVSTVRLVRWEPDGLWLGWYSAAPRFYQWDEVASVTFPSGEQLGPTVITLRNGTTAALHPRGRNLPMLLTVLESRVGIGS